MPDARNDYLSVTAKLLGDPGRAAIVLSLMGGIALPAGELAAAGNLAPQTASGHLAKLVEGRLLTVEKQGRHRYYRLSSAAVGDAVESLLVLTTKPYPRSAAADARKTRAGTLEHARTCYAHLAGWVGVRIADALEERALLSVSGLKTYAITPSGRDWFGAFGIVLSASPNPPSSLARRCLDWTERRHHLAGTLGCAMYRRFTELGWVAHVRDSRAVRITVKGKHRLWEMLRIPVQ
jgi:DNA-binding transcriptional ArsR family regulator